MKCTLDRRKLVAIADTGSDLNFMSPNCAEREGFRVDTRKETRRYVQFGDVTETETIPDPKEVYDDERHAEMLRRSRSEDEIFLLPVDQRDRAKAGERVLSREWNIRHAT